MRASVHNLKDCLVRVSRSFFNSVDWEGVISGWRIVRIRCTVDPICFGSGVEAPRAWMPRRVKTRHTLSLRPLESARRQVDRPSRNWATSWVSGRLPCGKKGCQMNSQRQVEIMCSTFRIRRKSATGDGSIGVPTKASLSLHSSLWTASRFCMTNASWMSSRSSNYEVERISTHRHDVVW